MLTGHGSFGHFLWRICKRETTECFHCAHNDDTLEYTLADYPAWDSLRIRLLDELDLDRLEKLTLSRIVEKILYKKKYWSSFIGFATSVMKTKEEEERRKRIPHSPF